MAEQERKQKRAEEPVSGEGAQPSAKVTEKGNKLKEEMDDLMDTIDDILEENAEEFLKSYVQRGGE